MVFGNKPKSRLEDDQQEELKAIIERLRRCYDEKLGRYYSIDRIANMFPVSSVTVYEWLGLRGGSLKRLNQARGLMCDEIEQKAREVK